MGIRLLSNRLGISALSVAAVMLSVVAAEAQNATVNWSADINNFVADSSHTNLLAPGDLVLIGSFNESFAAIQADPLPADLMSHFAQFGQTTVGTGVGGASGEWAAVTQNSSNNTTPFSDSNQRIYIWVFNSSSSSAATQQGIFSLSADSTHTGPAPAWIFPPDNAPGNTTTIDLQDLTTAASNHVTLASSADLVWGGYDSTQQNFFTQPFTAVPEPSTYALGALGAIGLLAIGRPNKK